MSSYEISPTAFIADALGRISPEDPGSYDTRAEVAASLLHLVPALKRAASEFAHWEMSAADLDDIVRGALRTVTGYGLTSDAVAEFIPDDAGPPPF